jgi:hypothetical protein
VQFAFLDKCRATDRKSISLSRNVEEKKERKKEERKGYYINASLRHEVHGKGWS